MAGEVWDAGNNESMGFGDIIGSGIDALKEGYIARETARSEVDLAKTASASPYAGLTFLIVAVVVIVLLAKMLK